MFRDTALDEPQFVVVVKGVYSNGTEQELHRYLETTSLSNVAQMPKAMMLHSNLLEPQGPSAWATNMYPGKITWGVIYLSLMI